MAAHTLFPEYTHSPSAPEIRDEFKERAYAELPFEMGTTDRNELFDAFRDFVQLCDEPEGNQLVEAVGFEVNDLGNGAYFMTYRRPGEINPSEPDRAPGTDHKYVMLR